MAPVMTKKRMALIIVLLILMLATLIGTIIYIYKLTNDANQGLSSAETSSVVLGRILTGGRLLAAENEFLQMYVNPSNGDIEIIDKKSGGLWLSSPDGAADDQIAQGLVRNTALSQISINFVDRASNTTLTTALIDSVNRGGLTVTEIPDGVRMDYYFPRQSIHVPVTYILEGDELVASILVNQVREDDVYFFRLHSILLLPYLGAGGLEDEGYLVIPDGGGALVYYNNGKARLGEYQQHVYGRDDAYSIRLQSTVGERVMLPLFGAVKNRAAYSAIISEGEARAVIYAHVSGARSSYNTVYAEFIYRNLDGVAVKEKNWDTRTIRIFESNTPSDERFTIRYSFLSGGEANYTGIATRLRRFLINEKGMKPMGGENGTPMFVEIYGGYMRPVIKLGIPVDTVVPFTTYGEAADIALELASLGVGDIYVVYKSWGKGGSVLDINSNLNTERALDGRRGFGKMLDILHGIGARVSVDINLLEINQTRLGYGVRGSAVRSLAMIPLQVHHFIPNSFQPNPYMDPYYYLKPSRVYNEAKKAAARFESLGADSLSPSAFGDRLYSDYGKNGMDISATQLVWENSLSTLALASPLVLSAPNAYALPAASYLIDIPVGSSSFNIADADAPLYQIALSGLLPMSVPSVNLSANPRRMMLKALEYGNNLKYTLNAGNLERLQNTGHEYLSATEAGMWMEHAAAMYTEAIPVLNKIAGRQITQHEEVMPMVNLTVFDNGISVLVNYGGEAVEYMGQNLDPMGFAMREGASVQ